MNKPSLTVAPNIFVDTAGWAELADTDQPHHAHAMEIYRHAKRRGRRVVTTNYVIAELVALLTSPLHFSRPRVIAYIRSLKISGYIEIVYLGRDLDEQSWQLLQARQDKQWSLVDCSSFVVMQMLGITEALTTDHHFVQAGFIRLLKS